MTLEEALRGKEIPTDIRDTLTIVTVPYFSFTGSFEKGQLVIHTDLVADVQAIFSKLIEMQFPIEKMVPVVAYGWDDIVSMQDNNTSAFNYRVIAGTTKMSQHAYGRAVDINPVQNPYIGLNGNVAPPGAVYDINKKGTVSARVAALFASYGWEWGGDWTDLKDWQHFQKPGQ